MTGAFFNNGRLYYTLAGKSAIYWRYFEPESGVIGAQEFHTGSSFQNVAGMVLSGSTLYYANKNDGTLHTVPFTNGSVGQGDKAVSGPKIERDRLARQVVVHRQLSSGSAPDPDGSTCGRRSARTLEAAVGGRRQFRLTVGLRGGR